jgi:hypothetical protein
LVRLVDRFITESCLKHKPLAEKPTRKGNLQTANRKVAQFDSAQLSSSGLNNVKPVLNVFLDIKNAFDPTKYEAIKSSA